jgi:amino acid transporter
LSVSAHVRTEVAFERTFGSHRIAQLILFGAFLSLLKIFNGNFVAATRMMYALGKRNVVHPALGRVHAGFGTPSVAIAMLSLLTVVGAMLGDAILVPVTEVGSLTVGIGWLSACVAFILRARAESRTLAWIGALVAAAIILMKIVPGVPGSFTTAEWSVFAAWSAVGAAFWVLRPAAR